MGSLYLYLYLTIHYWTTLPETVTDKWTIKCCLLIIVTVVKVILQKAASPPNMHSIPYTVYSLYCTMGCPPSSKSPLAVGVLGPKRVYNPNGISTGSAILAQLMAECHLTAPMYIVI